MPSAAHQTNGSDVSDGKRHSNRSKLKYAVKKLQKEGGVKFFINHEFSYTK